MTLGEIIKNYRAEHNLSQADFANRSGFSRGYVSMLENNKNPQSGLPIALTLETMQRAAIGMGMSVNDLFALVDQALDLSVIPVASSDASFRKPAAESSELDMKLEGIDFALYGEVKDLTEEQKRDVLRFVQFIKQKKD